MAQGLLLFTSLSLSGGLHGMVSNAEKTQTRPKGVPLLASAYLKVNHLGSKVTHPHTYTHVHTSTRTHTHTHSQQNLRALKP